MAPTLLHTGEAPVQESKPTPILVIGPAAHALAKALVRLKSHTEIHSADSAKEAIDLLKTKEFDHVLIDNRNDGALSLTIPALSRIESIGKLTVLAGPESSETISAIPGVGSVITAPYNPIKIANSLDIEIVDCRKEENSNNNHGRRTGDIAPPIEHIKNSETHGEVAENTSADEEIEEQRPIVTHILSALVNFIPSLTPIISMLYKNAALTILAALFIAFVSYGVMIAFFLTSGDWSTPLQLQRGHELVIKAERERGELLVKQNLIKQKIADAENKESRGQSYISRADRLAHIAKITIDQEIENRNKRIGQIGNEISSIQGVITSYGSSKERNRDKQILQRDYKARVITRQIYQSSLLNFAEIERSLVSLREQITKKKTELSALQQGVDYLGLLHKQLSTGNENIALIGGKAEFIPIVNQIIELQQARASGEADIKKYHATEQTLQSSLAVLKNSILELESTPMIRALDAPINVLFVPYDNLDAYAQGERLYTCAIAIFWCSEVGTVGAQISGEISTTHPFFGKPLRGQFVEAHLSDPSAAKKEIIHVGRPPLFF